MRFRARSLFISPAIAVLLAGTAALADDAPAAPEAKPEAQAPQTKPDDPPQTPAEARADLYARLAASKDADETAGLITLLLHS